MIALKQRFFTDNDCYKEGKTILPKGIMIHSTGANNPNLSRYVGPDDGLLGVNPNGNHWNKPSLSVCVHAFVGKLQDGTIATYQTLPWTMRGWHCGRGNKGSGNDSHISFEICEDGLTDASYFQAVYQQAVALTASLCKEYRLNPLADGVVICHAEGHTQGIASNHADVNHWFPNLGKTMDTFRADVKQEMEMESLTQAEFNTMMDRYIQQLTQQPPSVWSQKARAWAEKNGVIYGDHQGNYQYQNYCTREELVQILYAMQRL